MRTIAIGSGKGGVGKSSITANLAVILARQGHRVVAMDADFGLANLDVMLGVPAGPTLHDLVEGRNDLDEVLREHPTGVRILPGCSGVAEMADLAPHKLDGLLSSLHRLESSTDYLLVDVAAGVHEAAIVTLGAADEVLIVMNEDPSSFVDAYATFKRIVAFNPNVTIRVVVNEVDQASGGKLLFARMQAIVREHLGVSLSYVGSIHRDEEMVRAVRARATVFERAPDAPSTADLIELAIALAPNGLRIEKKRTSFFSRLFGLGARSVRAA